MIKYALLSLAIVVVCIGALPDVDKHHKCKSKIPALANLDSSKYAGKWYVDSSPNHGWLHSQCNEYLYKWHAMHYVHKNESYDGFFTYNLREINADDSYCWEACAYSRLGFLHGNIQRTIYSDCFYNATDTVQISRKHSPCYPKYNTDWKQWILATDYTNYSLVWLCSNNKAFVSLQSRSKAPLSAAVRKQAQMFLEKHGYNLQLKPANNTAC